MYLIHVSNYQTPIICPICFEIFVDTDNIVLLKHYRSTNKAELIAIARKKNHLFHHICIQKYFDSCNFDPTCPIDRELVHTIHLVDYYDVILINLIDYVNDYYQLLDKCMNIKHLTLCYIDQMNLNYRDGSGRTLLYCACQRGYIKIVRKLVKCGSSPIIPDYNGFTPLMAAVSHGYDKLVKYLCGFQEVRNTIYIHDKYQHNAIDYAIMYRHYNCVKILLVRKRKLLQDIKKHFTKKKHMVSTNRKYVLDIDSDDDIHDLVYVPQETYDHTNVIDVMSDHELDLLKTFNQIDSSLLGHPQTMSIDNQSTN